MRCAVALLVCALGQSVGRADVHVESNGCPPAATVADELDAILPAHPDDPVAPVRAVRIFDEGVQYRVEANGVVRVLVDPRRRCADRAHAAAVVADMAFSPPTADGPGARAQAPIRVDVATSGRLELAAGARSTGTSLSGGGDLRLEVGWRALAVVLGVRALAPSPTAYRIGSAELARIPVALGVRLGLRRGPIELSGLAGVSLSALRIEARGLVVDRATTRFDPAAQLGIGLRFWVRPRFALEATVSVDISFQRLDVTVDSLGLVGATPRAWVGFGLGGVFRARMAEKNPRAAPMYR